MFFGQSLRGILPEAEELAAFANCDTKTNCPNYGQNSCETIDKDCDGQCFWDGSECAYGNGNGDRQCNFGSRNACLNNNCEWVNGSCEIPSNDFKCSDYNNSSNQCQNKGCSWVSNSCVLICSDFDNTSRNKCEKSKLCTYKNNGNCDIRFCDSLSLTSRQECEDNTEYICSWYSSRQICSFSNTEEEE